MNYTWIIAAVVYIVLTHVIAQYVGAKREIGYGKSVFFSVLLTPIIGALFTVLSKAKTED